jgi:tRNA U54 and U55 pseudouridine synthase Pus10
MKYITVLDYEKGKVYQYNISIDMKTSYKKHEHWSPQCEVCEEYLTDKGHNLSNVEWMIHSDNEIITK